MKNMALHIMDIVQNSIRAQAGLIQITIEETDPGLASVNITDDGSGMTEEVLAKVTDPFYTSRTTRRVGLGIPLFRQSAEQAGGNFSVNSTQGSGTVVNATFYKHHPDMVPWGDIPGVIILMVAANPTTDFVYLHRTPKGEYLFDTREIKEQLDGVPINEHEVRRFLRNMLAENLTAIGAAGVLRMKTIKDKANNEPNN